ncbi:MAG: GmrSD restriction endonuclease domain-containing protein [Anaerolineae bacterium]
MAIHQQKVYEIVNNAVGKKVDIPELQREFIWSPEQVKLFAESLYRNYPVGSFLLWNSSDYQEPKTAKGTEISSWIVDGQQRTVALCLLLGLKPYWWDEAKGMRPWNEELERYDVMVNILSEDDDRLEFALPNPVRRRDPHWVSLREILAKSNSGDLVDIEDKIFNKLPEVKETTRRKVKARLQQLWQIRERDIPTIEITHEAEDVAEIFARLNQAGTRVKEADVILALVAVRNEGWVREDYLPFRSDLKDRGWDLDAGIYVRTMTALGVSRARLKEVPKDFWTQRLPEIWERTKDAFKEVIKRLQLYGILCADLLPSANSLIPLFTLHDRWHNGSDYRFGRAFLWFLKANWDGRYSGSAITTLNEDVRTIQEAKSFTEAIQKLSASLRVPEKVEPEEFLKRYDRAGNRFQRLLLYLLIFREGAFDWVDGMPIGYEKAGGLLNEGFEPQWHHIFPRSILKEKREDDDIHKLANITVLTSDTNCKKLGKQSPADYIKRFKIETNSLRRHLIPEAFIKDNYSRIEEIWDLSKYDDFTKARADLLAQKANQFLLALPNE